MRRIGFILASVMLAAALAGQQPKVVDRVAVVVDGNPILQSDIEAAAWFARFSAQARPALAGGSAPAAPDGRSPTMPQTGTVVTSAQLEDAQRHVIDEQLLDEQREAEGYGLASEAEVAEEWQQLVSAAGGEPALAIQLRAYHLDPATARAIVRRQLTLAAYLDQHFAGNATPTRQQEQAYYDHTFVPAARARGITPAAIATVRVQIAAIVQQQMLDQAEQQWLTQLRAAATIAVHAPF